ADETREYAVDVVARNGGRAGKLNFLRLYIIGNGRRAELDRRVVAFGLTHQLFTAFGRAADEQQQHTGRERIERAGVADLRSPREQALYAVDDARGGE